MKLFDQKISIIRIALSIVIFFVMPFFSKSFFIANAQFDSVQKSTGLLEYERVYNCGLTGVCEEKNNKLNAFDVQNLAPKTPKTIAFEISNSSDDLCQIYLNFKDLDNNNTLNEKIFIESSEAFKSTTFAKLLKKQSVFLSSLKPKESKTIFFTITLDGGVDNSFQGQKSTFKSTLYSFCLSDNKNEKQNGNGQVKGASTDLHDGDQNEDFYSEHKTLILLFSFTVLGSLVWNFVETILVNNKTIKNFFR